MRCAPISVRIPEIRIMEEIYEIKLPVFEGPLDLLLHLIREAKIDIYDIPISFITHRYLDYIEMMKELNLDIAGEFLVMAATLIHIKSRRTQDSNWSNGFSNTRLIRTRPLF
jgi:Segregation and condensation protein ScpA